MAFRCGMTDQSVSG